MDKIDKEIARRRRQRMRRKIWAATYAAAMVRQMRDHVALGHELSDKILDGMACDAATEADMAMRAWEHLPQGDQGPP